MLAGPAGCAPGTAAVIPQGGDDVGDGRPARRERSPRHARAGRREPVVGDPGRHRRARGGGRSRCRGATSADARVQSVDSEIAVRDRGPVADRARRPRALARLDDPAAARVDDEERREVRLVACRLAGAALAVRFERGGDRCERASSAVVSPFEPEPHEVHAEERRRAARAGRRRSRSSRCRSRRRARSRRARRPTATWGASRRTRDRAGVGDAEVLRVDRSPGRPRGDVRKDDLRFAGRPVGVLREHHARARAQAQRVAHGGGRG